MLQSKLFSKTLKEAPKDEKSINAQLLIRAGFIDKLMAGVYSYLPLGLKVLSKIENIIREEMNNTGAQEILMPILHPKINWEKTGRWQNLDVLFRLKGAGNVDYALGPTHEEIITPLAQKFVFSYKELPLYLYQIQTKFRNEPRARSGILRGREFNMKDLYSFHSHEKDLEEYYEVIKERYFKIFKRLNLDHITYLTFASGGSFSKYSHEFQTLAETGEDTIYLCSKCKIAINKEIIKEQENCPQCGNKDLEEKKSIEIANIFKLGTKYSKPFDFTYKNEKGAENPVFMGCYGIGVSRIMGTIAETSHDQAGIIWPKVIAPFHLHFLVIEKELKKKALSLYSTLQKSGIEVLFDDREDKSAGEKFVEADLLGLPLRLVLSKKTLSQNAVEIKERKGGIKLIKLNKIAEYVKQAFR